MPNTYCQTLIFCGAVSLAAFTSACGATMLPSAREKSPAPAAVKSQRNIRLNLAGRLRCNKNGRASLSFPEIVDFAWLRHIGVLDQRNAAARCQRAQQLTALQPVVRANISVTRQRRKHIAGPYERDWGACLYLLEELVVVRTAGLVFSSRRRERIGKCDPVRKIAKPQEPLAPISQVQTQTGAPFRLGSEWGTGYRVVLFVNDKSCAPCRRQLRAMQGQLARLDRLDTKVVAISTMRARAVAAMVKELGLTFPVYSDAGLIAAKAWGAVDPNSGQFEPAVFIHTKLGQMRFADSVTTTGEFPSVETVVARIEGLARARDLCKRKRGKGCDL